MLSSAALVARIRQANGDTQEALARRLGVSFPTINSWERGRRTPRPGHRRQLEELGSTLGVLEGPTVLVIDDDPVTGEIVTAAAAAVDRSIVVDVALDGWEGLLKCGQLLPDLLFLDIMMPGIDGIEVAKRLAGIAGLDDTVVVFVTASRDIVILERARDLGHDVLLKPFDVDTLEASLRGALAGAIT